MAQTNAEETDGTPGLKLSGNLRQECKNGLLAIFDQLCNDPGEVRYAVIRYDVMRRWLDTDDGAISPIMRILAWEPLEGDLRTAGTALYDQAVAHRTGQFNLEQVSL